MEFREIYCINCKKVLGRYNIKFYNEDKIAEVLKTTSRYPCKKWPSNQH